MKIEFSSLVISCKYLKYSTTYRLLVLNFTFMYRNSKYSEEYSASEYEIKNVLLSFKKVKKKNDNDRSVKNTTLCR